MSKYYHVVAPMYLECTLIVSLQVDQLSNAALELISEITRKADEEHAATLERNRATLEGIMDQDAPADLKRKVLATVTALKEGLLERETEVRCMLLLTSQHRLFHVFSCAVLSEQVNRGPCSGERCTEPCR